MAERSPDGRTVRTPTRRCSCAARSVPGDARAGDLTDARNWWEYVLGASWVRPEGPASDTYTRGRQPVVQVAARTPGVRSVGGRGAGERGRVGVRGARRAGRRGVRLGRRGRPGGHAGTAGRASSRGRPATAARGRPVGASRPTATGSGHDRQRLGVDRATRSHGRRTISCCAPASPCERLPRRVIKGGSHLCAPNYCLRFRPAARQSETIDTSTGHIGLRSLVSWREPAMICSPRSSIDR